MSSIAPVSARRGRFAHAARLAVLVGCGVAVAGCNSAIETVRSLRGINKNDPDPVTAPFSGNMAAAEAAPYPNLATVPPPPTRATSAAERQKLTETLVAERTAAATKWAGSSWAAAPAPPLPVAATAPATRAGSSPAPTLAAAAPRSKPIAAFNEAPGSRRSKSGEPDEAPPRDSELRMPQVRSVPEPEAPAPAPASPRLPPLPSPELAALPPAAMASATPQPPPSVPEVAPIAPPPAPSLGKTEPTRAPVVTTVAMFDSLDPGQIAQVAARYKESLGSPPRAVRVIAYTAPPAPGADPLGGYHDALERAQGVAKALTEGGIPEKMIQTEAKPAAGPIAAARIEIQFLP